MYILQHILFISFQVLIDHESVFLGSENKHFIWIPLNLNDDPKGRLVR